MTTDAKRPFEAFEIISASNEDPAEAGGWNLYTPCYGDTFLGNFRHIQSAAFEAVRLADEGLQSIEVL